MFDDTSDLEHLVRVCDALDEFGVRWWLDQGTCLGFVREQGPMAWDDDLDMGVWADDAPEGHPVWSRFEELGYCVAWNHQVDFTKLAWPGAPGRVRSIDIARYQREGERALRHFGRPGSQGPMRIANGMLYHVRNATRQAWARRNGAAEGFLFMGNEFTGAMRIPQRALQVGVGLAAHALPNPALRRLLRSTIAKGSFRVARLDVVTPSRFYDQLQDIEARGRTWRVPSPVEDYLAFKFGDDWRIPRRDWHHFTDDGAVVK